MKLGPEGATLFADMIGDAFLASTKTTPFMTTPTSPTC